MEASARKAGKLSRRWLLRAAVAGGAGAVALVAVGGCGETQIVEVIKEVPVEKIKEVVVEKVVTQIVEKPVASTWVTGKIDTNISGDFHIMSWESEGEMRKFLLHIGNFFKQNYPKMRIKWDWGNPWGDFWTKLQTSIAGGSPPEYAWMHDTRGRTYPALGLLVPLDDYIKAFPPPDWPEKFYPSQVDAFKFEGKQYAIPYDWAPGAFYVNEDMLAAAGVEIPTAEDTFDDVKEKGLKLTKKAGDKTEVWGLSYPYDWPGGMYWMTRAFGGEWVTEEPWTSHFDDPKTAVAYRHLYDLLWKDKVSPTADVLSQLGMGSGGMFAAGLVGLHWSLNDEAFRMAEAIGGKFSFTAAPSPAGPAGRFTFSGGSAHSIPTGTKFPDIAYECIRWALTNPDNLPVTGVMGSMFVARMDMWEFGIPTKEQMRDPDAFKVAMYDHGRKEGIAPIYHQKYEQWETAIFNKEIQRLWANETDDVDAILAKIHTDTKDLIATL